MKKSLLTFFIFCSLFSSAQNPLVKKWDHGFGGSSYDYLTSFQQTADGGYIMGGYSISGISGDKTQNTQGYYDYWIVKIDSLGNKQWDKDFGGTSDDELLSVQQTTEGGYILGGWSQSGISGDKTQPVWGVPGDKDYWIVKTDSLGNKQWDKDFGGTGYDDFRSLQPTADGGYILGGISASPISGDKTQATWGNSYDYWIIKIDSLGNKQWDKDFGGTDADYLETLEQTTDGGYILGGISYSGISGDKTQALWGTNGYLDYWIVKIDSLGNKKWDKDFGGIDEDWLYSIQQTTDGGYLLGGRSNSGISGDKTQPSWGDWDYWIVKTDSLGNKQWDKDFGGTSPEDEFDNIFQTYDGGYLLGGTSYSPISGDKTENNLGQEQSWIIKTDFLGNKQWDKTIFTPCHDERGLAIQTYDGCFAIANFNYGGIGGYKTQVSQGQYDFWIVKFCEELQANLTSASFMCAGTCIDFSNLSFLANTYQWSFSGAIPPTSTDVNPTNICYANPGSYDVQLIAINANGSDTLLLANYITVYPAPPPQSITQNGDTLFAIAGAGTYQWYFNGNIINGATNYFYVADTSGDYNMVCTDGNGCEVEAAVFNVVAGLTPALSKGEGVAAAPNPVTDKLFLISSLPIEKAEIKIYNLLGEMVLAVSPLSPGEGQGGEADVRSLAKGMYWIEILSSEKTFRGKFVKE